MLAGASVGFGFLTKMLQSLLVVPAFALVYLCCAPTTVRRRIVQLLISGAAMIASAGWWVASVELTPAADRYFPQRYDKMLNAVLREIRSAGGDDAVKAVFERIGKRSADRLGAVTEAHPAEEQLTKVVAALRASGVNAELQKTERGTMLKWGPDHRIPAARYWPSQILPPGLTVTPDYPRASPVHRLVGRWQQAAKQFFQRDFTSWPGSSSRCRCTMK